MKRTMSGGHGSFFGRKKGQRDGAFVLFCEGG